MQMVRSLQGLLEEMGCELRELAWPDQWWWRGESAAAKGRLAPGDEADPDLEWVERAFEEVGSEAPPETDVSAEQWLRNKVGMPR